MFYGTFVLTKKGPLAKIWLAAHWEKKLTKAHVYETNVEKAVESILEPKVRMALRTTGHLLLGLVRIHSRKAKYLLADCNEAFIKMKMAFRPDQDLNLADDEQMAQPGAITLPDVLTDFPETLPDFDIEDDEDDEAEQRVGTSYDPMHEVDDIGMEFDDTIEKARHSTADHRASTSIARVDDITLRPDRPTAVSFRPDDDILGPVDMTLLDEMDDEMDLFTQRATGLDQEAPAEVTATSEATVRGGPASAIASTILQEGVESTHMTAPGDHTTLIPNEDDAFALDPIDVAIQLRQEQTRQKRRRKLIVDEVKSINAEDMKMQLQDWSDTTTNLDLAPPTKQIMTWKETGNVEKLFSSSSLPIHSTALQKLFSSCLITRSVDDDDGTAAEDRLVLEDAESIASEQALLREREEQMSEVGPARHSDAALPPIPEEASGSLSRGRTRAPLSPGSPIMQAHDDVPSVFPELDTRLPEGLLDLPSGLLEEEFEDEDEPEDVTRKWNNRTEKILKSLHRARAKSLDEFVSFKDFTKGNTRKLAAQKFYALLVLQKYQQIEASQEDSFGDIRITAPSAEQVAA